VSEWLGRLGLKQGFGLAQGDFALSEVPDWAAFLIWAGWWMRRAQVPDTRIFMVVLLPNRSIAASLTALGAMIGSIGRTGRSLDWHQFLKLPVGAPVFLRMEDPKRRFRLMSIEGKVGPWDKGGDSLRRQIALVSDQARLQGVTLSVAPKRFFEYDISVARHSSPRQARRLAGSAAFFSNVCNEFEDSWLAAPTPESVVVTNRARWARQIEELNVTAARTGEASTRLEISRLLMCGTPELMGGVRTVLLSPKSEFPESKSIPVGVLDGAEALRSWELVHAPNLLVLLEQAEYAQGARDDLAQLAGARDDSKLPIPEHMPDETPGGIDLMMFALSNSQPS
jgi:hypothetical protein